METIEISKTTAVFLAVLLPLTGVCIGMTIAELIAAWGDGDGR